MLNRIRGFASATLLAVASIGLLLFSVAAQQVPQQLPPPANEQLFLQVHAKGDQVYTCKADVEQYAWDFESSRRPALRQKRQALRQTFRRPVLGSKRR